MPTWQFVKRGQKEKLRTQGREGIMRPKEKSKGPVLRFNIHLHETLRKRVKRGVEETTRGGKRGGGKNERGRSFEGSDITKKLFREAVEEIK